jgi:hypothetical protein
LWKFAETLEIRTSELKTRSPPSLRQYLDVINFEVSQLEEHDSAEPEISSGYDIRMIDLGVRILRLEVNRKINYNFDPNINIGGRLCCPDPDCIGDFSRGNSLTDHLRREHGSAGSVFAGRVCYSCGYLFDTTRELIDHEKVDHAESYDSRIERYLPFFK